MRIFPLENFSSLHETSINEQLDWKIKWPGKPIFLQFSFNLHTPLKIDPRAHLIFDTKDANSDSAASDCCFRITRLTRWRLDISSYQTFDDYLKALIRWHRCNYVKSKRTFFNYGCEISFMEDWSEYAEEVYRLYDNVARRYHHKLYNLPFFQEIARHPDCKLVCAWFEGKLIAVFVLQEELPTLHAICAGLDYQHSSASYAYSWMNYALFEYAINAQRYQNIDLGFNSDEAKKIIGLQPITSRIDVYSTGRMPRKVLKMFSHFVSATITPDAKLKFKLGKNALFKFPVKSK